MTINRQRQASTVHHRIWIRCQAKSTPIGNTFSNLVNKEDLKIVHSLVHSFIWLFLCSSVDCIIDLCMASMGQGHQDLLDLTGPLDHQGHQGHMDRPGHMDLLDLLHLSDYPDPLSKDPSHTNGRNFRCSIPTWIETRPDTQLPQSRAGGQEQCWKRLLEHLGRSSRLN